MHNVIPFPPQPNMKLANADSIPPDAPWWLQHMAEEDRVVFCSTRAQVLVVLQQHKAEPRRYNRAHLRDQIAGGVHSCAVTTDLPLDLMLDDLASAGELTAEEMASPHMGRTPWRKRVMREEKLARNAALRRPRFRPLH